MREQEARLSARVSARAGVGVRTRVCAQGSGSVGVSDGGRACGKWPRRGGRWGCGVARWVLLARRGAAAGFSDPAFPPSAGRRERSGAGAPSPVRGAGKSAPLAGIGTGTDAPSAGRGHRGGDRCPFGGKRDGDRCPLGRVRGEGPGQVPHWWGAGRGAGTGAPSAAGEAGTDVRAAGAPLQDQAVGGAFSSRPME